MKGDTLLISSTNTIKYTPGFVLVNQVNSVEQGRNVGQFDEGRRELGKTTA